MGMRPSASELLQDGVALPAWLQHLETGEQATHRHLVF